jgi:hypothetical protein
MNAFDDLEYGSAAELSNDDRGAACAPKSRFRTMALQELRSLELPEREMVLSPIVPAKGLAMIYAARGVGKTQIGIGASYAVATDGSFLRWRALQPRRVLYIDGEMPARALQDRINVLAPTGGSMPNADYFRFLAMDLQDLGTSCNLANPEDQRGIEAELRGAELVVLDNLSTLVSAGRENDAESWDAMQAWLLHLRRRGVSVLMIHHAGRGDNARGTSKREDVLDTVIHLRHPDDYSPEQGARFEVHLKKARGIFGTDATPFEARLAVEQGKAVWTTSALRDLEVEQVLDMSQARMSVRDIAAELGIGKSKVSRLQVKLKEDGRL